MRRFKTWIILLTSSSRPITGSSLPLRAKSVKSVEYFSKAFMFSSAFLLSTLLLPLIFFITPSTEFEFTFISCNAVLILLLSSFVIASRIDSIPTKSSLILSDSSIAISKSRLVSFDKYNP